MSSRWILPPSARSRNHQMPPIFSDQLFTSSRICYLRLSYHQPKETPGIALFLRSAWLCRDPGYLFQRKERDTGYLYKFFEWFTRANLFWWKTKWACREKGMLVFGKWSQEPTSEVPGLFPIQRPHEIVTSHWTSSQARWQFGVISSSVVSVCFSIIRPTLLRGVSYFREKWRFFFVWSVVLFLRVSFAIRDLFQSWATS